MTTKCSYKLEVFSNENFELTISHKRYKRYKFSGNENSIFFFDSFTSWSPQSFEIHTSNNIIINSISVTILEHSSVPLILKQKINGIDLHPHRTSNLSKSVNFKPGSTAQLERLDTMQTFVPMHITSVDHAYVLFTTERVISS